MFKLFFKYGCEFDGTYSECQPAVIYFKVSSKTLTEFRDSFIEEFRTSFLGEGWQSGDSGATYQILEENVVIRENDESVKLEYLQNGTKFYLEKSGKLEQVEINEFEMANDNF